MLPAATTYTSHLCTAIVQKQAALPGDPCRVEKALAASVSQLNATLLDRTAELKTALDTMPASYTAEQQLHYCHDEIFARMQRVREIIDHMETLVAADFWPVPTYYDLLFSV